MIFENYPLERKIGDAASLDSDGFVIEKMETTEQTHYDFNLIVAPGSQYLVKFNFNARVYRRDFIHRLSCHFMKALDQAVRDPEINIKEITLLTEGEKEELLIDFNDTRRAYPEDKTIDRLFAEQACQTPHRLALVFEKGQPGLDRTAQRQWHITYTELNGMAAHLSLVLKDRGVCPGTPVGIMLERSIEMISGLLAILKAGGIYLPINPDYPERRRRYMLADSGARLVFTDNSLSGLSRVSPVNHRLFTSNLAYLIYTSGTTGEPKGVMVEHGNVIRLVKNSNYIEFKEGERLLPTGALEFDASTFEIWGALLNGLSLCLVCKKKILAADRFKAVLQKYTITTIWLTSSLFNQMVQADIGIFSGLKNLLLGGEVLLPVHVNRVRKRYPALNVINGYGPTENTTFSTTFLIDREYAERIPIGRPIANSTAYILDRWGKLQPIGVPGELWVGGDGVSRGYLNNPDLTAERFITHQILAPKSYILNPKSQILYRTGDLCRFLPEGDIEFLGRIDHQVKIRGFRIEPGEIENHLLKHPHVKEAVVLAREDEGNEKYLTAYIVPHSTTKTNATSKTNKISLTNEFRHHLSHRLPPYMIPSHFVFLDRVPLTPNGKLDRQALPQPMVETGKDFFASSGEVEEKLAEIWSEILSVPQETIGVNADFFDLGGHSLRATLLSTRINRELAVKVPMEDIFSKPTLREMAKYIEGVGEKRRGERLLSIDAVEKREYYPLSSAQKRLYILQQMEPNSTVCNIPRVMLLEGKIDLEKLGQVFQQLIRRHEGFRTSFGVVHEEPLQRVHDEVEWGIEYIEPVEPASRDKLIRDFVRPFDLTRPPLLRVGLVQEGHTSQEGNYILMLDVHHIIIDGVSISIFIKEFTDLYRGHSLPPLRCQYKDYSQWQQRFKESREMEKQERYWLNRFSGQIPRLNLPSDFPHPRGQSFDAGALTFKIDPELTARTRQTARQAGATLYMVLLAVYNVLLAKYSGDEDIVVGMGIFGRRHADLENIVGMFVNMLAMRNEPTPAKTFAEFLEEVKQSAIDAYENQDYQFEELVHKLNIPRESGKNPVFEVEFTLHNMDSREIEIPGLKLSFYEYEHKKTKFDLALQARQTGNTITLALSYTTARFKPSTAEYISRHFVEILRQVAEGEDIKLEHIAISRESADVTSRFKQEDFGGFDI